MPTTATLTIEALRTYLTLTDDSGRPVQPREHINVLGNGGGGWTTDHVTYFRAAADSELAERGYKRVGDWTYQLDRDAHIAPITGA